LFATLTKQTEVRTLNNRILNTKIRKINKDEYELVADMFDKYRIFYKQPSDIELAKQYLKNRLANNEAQIFVAFDSKTSELLGFTLLYARFSSVSAIKNWHIGDLYVEPNQRKRGIGHKLLQTAVDYATEHKAKYISLNTAKDNFTAQKVYEDFGFDKREFLPEYLNYQFDL
jgi:ribosomal protein S18 acetylase RimI-like enzyme